MTVATKRPKIITHSWDDAGKTITFTVLGSGHAPIVFNTRKVSAANHKNAEQHGWEQRIPDGAALSKDKNGNSASPADKAFAMKRLVDHYMSGTEEWSMERSSGPRGPRFDPIILAAIMEFYKSTDEEAMKAKIVQQAEALNATVDETLQMMAAKSPVLKPIVERMRAEEAAKLLASNVSGQPDAFSELMMGLGDEEEGGDEGGDAPQA